MQPIRHLAPILLVLSLAATLPASADVFCANGTLWTFHHGQTGVTFSCNSTNNNSATASAIAESACQDAWDQVDHLVSADGFTYHLNTAQAFPWDPTWLRWTYVCQACIDGYPPAWADKIEHEVQISAGDAGGIGSGLVGGVAVGIKLRDLGERSGPNYYVDVVKGSESIQVIVNAVTGQARLARDAAPGSCRGRG